MVKPMKKSSATHTIQPEVIEELRTLVREAEQALAAAGDTADDKVKALRERMKHALDEGRETFRRVRESTREHLEEADEYVRDHPYQTIGLAALAGVLVGVLITRKTD